MGFGPVVNETVTVSYVAAEILAFWIERSVRDSTCVVERSPVRDVPHSEGRKSVRAAARAVWSARPPREGRAVVGRAEVKLTSGSRLWIRTRRSSAVARRISAV